MKKTTEQKKIKHVLYSILGIVLIAVVLFITNLITNCEPSLLSVSIITPVACALFAFSAWNFSCLLENEKLRAMIRLFIRIGAIVCFIMSLVLICTAV